MTPYLLDDERAQRLSALVGGNYGQTATVMMKLQQMGILVQEKDADGTVPKSIWYSTNSVQYQPNQPFGAGDMAVSKGD